MKELLKILEQRLKMKLDKILTEPSAKHSLDDLELFLYFECNNKKLNIIFIEIK